MDFPRRVNSWRPRRSRGVVLTKLDSTSKGGIVLAIAAEIGLPVKLIGVGEAIDDLRDFDADEFVRALFPGLPSAKAHSD